MHPSNLLRTLAFSLTLPLMATGSARGQSSPPPSAQSPTAAHLPPVAPSGEYALSQFGDVSTPAAIRTSLSLAVETVRQRGGGTIIIDPAVDQTVDLRNLFETARTAGAVGQATVTIIDRRAGYERHLVPALGKWSPNGFAGETIQRDLNVAGPGVGTWGTSQALSITNNIIQGSSSYLHPVVNEVPAGKDARLYLHTERGLFVGQQLNYYIGQYYSNGFENVVIKSLGWDNDRKLFFATTDATKNHAAGAYLSNKNMVGSLTVDVSSNADNQTAGEVNVVRKQYANGDSFLFGGQYIYQGDVLTQLGDEAGVVFNAEPQQDPNPFHSKVESMNSLTDELVFAPGPSNVQKLASSRPLINLNSKKWLTSGNVKIVGQDNWAGLLLQDPKFDTTAAVKNGINLATFAYRILLGPNEKPVFYPEDYTPGHAIPNVLSWDGHAVTRFKYPYRGKAYPSIITGGYNYLGGRIIASADCGWSPAVVGRYFAVSEKSERLYPGDPTIGSAYMTGNAEYDTYRWYLITDYWKNPDGTHGIRLGRVRQFAAGAGAPNLYNDDNYTRDGHEKPLSYIIAPGAMVYDISRGWKQSLGGDTTPADPRTVKIIKNSATGTELDFAPGDPLTQAIGPDPALPRPIRIRMFNQVPNNVLTGAIEVGNYGKVQITSGLSLSGGGQRLEDIGRRKDNRPSFQYGLYFDSLMGTGIQFNADTSDAAIRFAQPFGHAQPLKWDHAKGTTALTVDPATGEMEIKGSPLKVPNLTGIGGLSSSAVQAHNLRGVNVPVPQAAQFVTIIFAHPEIDAAYSLTVQPGWLTQDAIVSKSANGFRVQFSNAAPRGATLDWQLIR